MSLALGLVAAAGLGLAGDTLRRVWRGGTTLNDHAVAAVVLGCFGIYPVLAWGAERAGVLGPALGLALAAGAVGIWGLFWVLDQRREAGPVGMGLARLSQLAYAMSLWTGLLLLLRAPVALALGAPLCWPGPLLALPLGLAAWGLCWTWARRFTLRRLRLPLDGPGRLRVVQLSDLHASPVMRADHLDRLVDRVAALTPDLVVVTGDLVMPFSEQHHPQLLRALARLRALAPVAAVPGNHDLPVAAVLGDELAALDVHWLVDQRCRLTLGADRVPVELVGLDFRWTGLDAQLAAVLAAAPPVPAAARLLLAHDPRVFRHVPPGRFTLVLSGHTHGGQVGLQMFGLRGSLLGLFGVADHGLFQRPGARMWVHAGNWHTGLPPRMGVAPELVVVDLAGPPRPQGSTAQRSLT